MLGDEHDREAFGCGSEPLERYLRRQARQEADRRVAVTYVAVPIEQRSRIAGFYTLSATAVRLASLPPELAKRLLRYPDVPATLIGRLAVGQDYQGRGLGGHLLVDALKRSREASSRIGSVAVVVDAKDERANDFYAHYGFMAFPDHPTRLFLPMKTIERVFARRSWSFAVRLPTQPGDQTQSDLYL